MKFLANTGKSRLLPPLILCILVSLLYDMGYGVDPNTRLSQYAHTAWRVQDGVLNIPTTMAQTADGYIWFGTQAGLTRFDGVRFVPWTPPSGEQLMSVRIDSLLAANDGSLWIGTAGGLSHWQNNHLTNYVNNPGVVVSVVQSRTGSIWILMTPSPVLTKASSEAAPLCRITGTQMECYGKDAGIPPDVDEKLVEDSNGEFWIGGSTSLVHWSPQSHNQFNPAGLRSNAGMAGILALAPEQDGALWVGMASPGRGLGLQRLVKGRWERFSTRELKGESIGVERLLLDRNDALWVGTNQHGIYRIYRDQVDHFGSADGLSSDNVRSLLEDHEGNVWIVTTKGIDNFRSTPIVSFSSREGLSTTEVDTVFASRNGSIWVGGFEALDVLRGPSLSITPKRLPGHQITSVFEDHLGRLWVGIDNNLTVYQNGGFRTIKRRNGDPTGMIVGITEDVDGDIWAESRGTPMTLIRIRDFLGQEEFTSPEMPAARRVAPDPHGGIWLGMMNGDLARYQRGRTETFHFEHTPDSRVEQITVNPEGSVLGATAFGLIGWTGGRQVTLTIRNGLPCNGVYAFAFDDLGDLWLNTECGISEIPVHELQKWWRAPSERLKIKSFDVFDGAQPGRAPFVSGAKSSDGRVWFADGMVLQMVDPNHLSRNSIAPPVHIEQIVADHKTYAPKVHLLLPPLTRDLEINYTALSFVAPPKVRFRYLLEGHDVEWQEPGSRRQAFYSNLRPGNYKFRVMACNNDGVWNEEGDSLIFRVSPAWYQTIYFQFAGIVLITFSIWALYQLRMRQVERDIAARFDERLAERTRLARELHDTLVQTIQGSKMVADNALDEATDFPRMRQAMERVSVWLGQATQEGRAALNSLRTSTVQTNDLAESFRRAIAECRLQGFPQAVFASEGTATEMHPIVRDEIYRIGSEAIRNACQHSGASRLDVHLSYSEDLVLRISDDGRGIEPKIAEKGREGHYGLQGMRERAHRINATLTLNSSAPGTIIELIVPGSIIFQRPLSNLSNLLSRLKKVLRSG
jgi:signal transduction histidine kinase/ligand-binding sensor domain-containing protein